MNERVAAVEPMGHNAANLRPTEPGASRAAGNSDVRFAYPSGSRPLEGFTLKRGIGHGGFGEVYFATSDAGKEVALKLIRRNFDVELRGVRHCLNLKHPNLLAIYDIREDDKDDRWVVMEHVSGDSLEDAVNAHPNGMPTGHVLSWFHGICAGVGCLHDHGVVHRDLKPGNIFCDEGVVKIGDYGLSKFISCSHRSGQTESIGTVHYMAPEVANGRYGKEIDIYALGIVLYEMLTGRVPFEGESVGEVLMKHLTAKPDVSMLAEPYRSVVARALDKDPARRFPNVAQMLACLPQPAAARVHAGPRPFASGATAAGRPAAFATPGSEGEADDEEPILRAVRQFFHKTRRAWQESRLDSPARTFLLSYLLVLGLVVLVFTAGGWIPLALSLLFVYFCYWVVRSLVLAFTPRPRQEGYSSTGDQTSPWVGSPGRPVTHPSGPSPGPVGGLAGQAAEQAAAAQAGRYGRARHRTMPRWARRERPADVLVLKSGRERATELIGSMVGGALTSITMCLVMLMLNSFRSAALPEPQLWAWLMLASIAATWAVMIPSKFWEGTRGDALVRRFILMAAGMAVGAAAGGAAWLLKVNLPYDPEFSEAHRYVLPGFYADGTPLVLAFMACFGTLFFAVRWWRLADPLRSTRMSLWSMIFSVLIAWLVAAIWLFPQPWLMMVACATSVSVQLASPWVNPHRRRVHG